MKAIELAWRKPWMRITAILLLVFVLVLFLDVIDQAIVPSTPVEDDHLGAAAIDYAGHHWLRVTNSTAGAARIPAMAYDEVLYRHQPARRDDDLTHYAMLYSRDVPELAREEFLLVSAEDSGPHEFSITYSVGVDLTTADIDIT